MNTVTVGAVRIDRIAAQPGVAAFIRRTAEEVAATSLAFQDPHMIPADSITVVDSTMDEMGIGPVNTPVSNVVFTGKGWHDTRGDQMVAGTPNSGKKAIDHLAGGS